MMSSNAIVQTARDEGKFAMDIRDGWEKARQVYLSESGIKEDSEEWKFIMQTKQFSEIVDVLNETWAHHYNNPSVTTSETPSPQFVTPPPKKTGFKAVAGKLKKRLGIKPSGEILLQPGSKTRSTSSYVDSRLELEQQLSGKPSTTHQAIDQGLQIADTIQNVTGSEKSKEVVNLILKYSEFLQTLAGVSELVHILIKYHSNLQVGAICFPCFG